MRKAVLTLTVFLSALMLPIVRVCAVPSGRFTTSRSLSASAQYSVKVAVDSNGRQYAAGMGIGVEKSQRFYYRSRRWRDLHARCAIR
ncbi:DUF1983 domain-containing protein [Pantoea sp. Eser]|nr:DUF1983 domain-containing protein [Pantoea sp. Eser]